MSRLFLAFVNLQLSLSVLSPIPSPQRRTTYGPMLHMTSRRATFGLIAATVAAAQPSPAVAKGRDEYPLQQDWARTLTSGQYFVLRKGGTEPSNSSPLAKEKRRGTFVCAGCGTPLFASDQKFESGTGWPSFATCLEGVEIVKSITSMLLGSELRCSGCGGHLGDIFDDGRAFRGTPAEISGKRYCIDGAALSFRPADGGEAISGDGLSQRRYEKPADVELPGWMQPPKVG